MISGACSASPARYSGSGDLDFLDLKLETLEWGAGFQQLEIVEPLGLTVGGPHLHSPLLGHPGVSPETRPPDLPPRGSMPHNGPAAARP